MAAWPWESSITPCDECGYKDVPTFRQERRIAYRETGERGTEMYSRQIAQVQDALVCISCGHVQDVEMIIS
jgi:hypothetical protein